MGSLFFAILPFIAALAILITVHEYGHFLVARKLNVKVLRFSIGFGRALWKRTSEVDGTEYVIAGIPLGGYVRMLDEQEAPVDPEEQHRAFNRQSLGVRSAIVLAGPLFNFLFAILAFWLIFVTGDPGLKPVVGKVKSGSIAEQVGFIPGDEILSVANQSTPTWGSVAYILLSEARDSTSLSIQVRDKAGDEQHYQLQGLGLLNLSKDGRLLQNLGLIPDRPVLPSVIGDVAVGGPAEEAGLRPGDRIISVDGSAVDGWNDWVRYVRERPLVPLNLEVDRDGEIIPMDITPEIIEGKGKRLGRIGASATVPDNLMDDYRVVVKYGPVDAIGQSVTKTWDLSLLMLRMLGKMVIGEVSVKNLGGPMSMAASAGKSVSYGVSHFLKFLAVVSVSLGVFNLLPIPVLDGGHLFFFLIEAIHGKPLSERFMKQGRNIGLLILLGLMVLSFYIDLNRFLG
ncbi:MAG: RIP metalloprotease RseP [Candidatus Thiodiazotropha sp. (ex Lucinoma aequizonata)]|nr:RIP metalloprotease RseP [Candidatus Thiodiazotropha sp. (ex Lucinoma aequizonata)]MCU7887925.1 RIP metalloprotease RseP [Candidatus Thiodiazotropha sp. (ex Lucinoma aequizonata)]MCU7897108.1 RIP metalloprotease RseP [Candidatus Thiodiazotropha sp. (ex Lucinoma aequizonata)]MCU7899734.1 RIP metalloprotease RseP [Candidatus Thiodiazotropha sp. (ex Lucinoma aequizonata)]MCU7901105.1 RIP metalloprotease RseP [Candidatus Thiodiazotropha sp. (ex Lucinoma aequizonata)]